MWTRTGTIFYQAPEIFEGGGYDAQVDMWALGVILFQMLCQKLPY
jgi:calcium-dependent protein kinase